MTPEKRLLLALTLTLTILLAWSLFSPPSPPGGPIEKLQPIENKIVSIAPPSLEPGLEFSIDPIELEVDPQRGGIQSIRIEGADLLMNANPGLFQAEMIKPADLPLRFETRWEEGRLQSLARSSSGIEITRQLSKNRDGSNYLARCKLQLKNSSSESQQCQMRMVTYRPLYFSASEGQQYRYTMVSAEGKNRAVGWKEGHTQNFPASPEWIVAQGKSYGILVQPLKPAGMFHVEHSSGQTPVGWLTLPVVELAPGQTQEWEFKWYAGPLSLKSLRQAGVEQMVSFGAFSGITKILFRLLSWSHGWLKNYGLAILVISFLIWLLFFPVTWAGIRMTKTMGKLQSHVERIRREHGKDQQRTNREMMQLYQKHRVNPLSGCLPLFLQMPIFIALYQVLSRSPELKGASFLWIRDLSGPDALVRFPSEIPLIGRNLNLLPILMAVLMFFQQRMTQTPQAGLSDEQALQQKMFKWFPLLFGFLFYGLPSGLVLYWVTNTLLTLGQYRLYARLHPEMDLRSQGD